MKILSEISDSCSWTVDAPGTSYEYAVLIMFLDARRMASEYELTPLNSECGWRIRTNPDMLSMRCNLRRYRRLHVLRCEDCRVLCPPALNSQLLVLDLRVLLFSVARATPPKACAASICIQAFYPG